MKVLKFGGSSLANASKISAVMDIVISALADDKVLLVCSAISTCTDSLLEIAATEDKNHKIRLIQRLQSVHNDIIRRLFTGSQQSELSEEIADIFAQITEYQGTCVEAFGEILITRILAAKFSNEIGNTVWLDSRELIRTKNSKVDEPKTYANIASSIASLPETRLFIAPGFVAKDENNSVTTLGRGGSDYSAALFAAAINASSLQIWTDVPGIMSANPKELPSARTINTISFEAAQNLAENGAKVLYAPTVQPARQAGIDIHILNTFDPGNPGTIICRKAESSSIFYGVTSMNLAQSQSSRICLIGEHIVDRASVEARIHRAIAESGLAIQGEIYGNDACFFANVSNSIRQKALAAIHAEFFEQRQLYEIPLYIAGYGAVGKNLISLIEQNSERIASRHAKSVRIVGVADSKHFIIDNKGVKCEDLLKLSQGRESAAYVDEVIKNAPRRAVFVDCTDDNQLYLQYEKLFKKGINIVCSNRRSIAIPYSQYYYLKRLAAQNGCFFRYDTTVGNAMPILESIAGSANCSDSIESIEAALSCTMNFILTQNPAQSFKESLNKAKERSLLEKDPRIDLGGKDVLRKLLILAREAGVPLEEKDVTITPLLSEEFFSCGIDEFYQKLSQFEPEFISAAQELESSGKRRRFVCSLTKDSQRKYKAEIGLKTVEIDSPFYWISGTENVIIVNSENSEPLVIKGAGEGAKQAATGIIRDILL